MLMCMAGINSCGCAGVVDVCLIPEVKFDLDGPRGLMAYLEKLLTERDHCVICVAEGAGQVTFNCQISSVGHTVP